MFYKDFCPVLDGKNRRSNYPFHGPCLCRHGAPDPSFYEQEMLANCDEKFALGQSCVNVGDEIVHGYCWKLY